jgi:hypothetical protein
MAGGVGVVVAIQSARDTQRVLDVGHHRVRQARLAELRKVVNDDLLNGG